MRKKRVALVGVVAATAMLGATPLVANASTGTDDAAKVSAQDGRTAASQHGQAVKPESRVDFSGTGVRIFSQASAGSSVVGHGNQGDYATELDGNVPHGEPYTCDHGGTSTGWLHVRNDRTGVTGFVPSCNMTYS